MDGIKILKFNCGQIKNDQSIFDEYNDPKKYIVNAIGNGNVFILNPNFNENDIALAIAVDKNLVVGSLGFIKSNINAKNSTHPVLWLSSFFLDDKYKNSGAGAMLLFVALSYKVPLLASGGPNEACQALYKASGFKQLNDLKRYLFFYDISPIITYVIGSNTFSNFISLIINFIYKKIISFLIGFKRNHDIVYEPVNEYDESIDFIQEDECFSFFAQDYKNLNWSIKLCKKNTYPYKIYYENKLIGVCLLRIKNESYNGLSMELGSLNYYSYQKKHSNLKFKVDLIKFCKEFFFKKNVQVFEVQSYDKDLFKSCKKSLMFHKGGNKVFFKGKKFDDHVLSHNIKYTKSISDVLFQ